MSHTNAINSYMFVHDKSKRWAVHHPARYNQALGRQPKNDHVIQLKDLVNCSKGYVSANKYKVGLIVPIYFNNLVDKETIMFSKTLKLAALSGVLVFAAGSALADDQDRTRLQDRDQTKDQIQDQTPDQDRDRDRIQDRDQDRIYGSQLMTAKERNEYRARIRSAKTAQEREQIRAEHHERMRARAKERGVTIPDEPPMRGGGMGPGGSMAPGGGMMKR